MQSSTIHSVCLLAILLVTSIDLSARTRKVLFIGNSYIYTNDIPGLLKGLVDADGDTIIYDSYTPGGYTLEGHSTDANTLAKIKSNKWDMVILQEQSQKPSFPTSQVAIEVYPFAKKLDTLIRNNHACSETMFYMTWGRKNGDAGNCGFHPPVCTYAGMQAELHKSYMQMAQDNKGVIAPVGVAWKELRDSLPTIDLYSSDESHPSVAGSYLAACVFYASIFHRNPHGNSFTSTLSATDAERLQYYAGKVVMDSLNQWQQYGDYVYAGFDYSVIANDVTFTNTSLKGMNYTWHFGDGDTSTMLNPSHTYTANGKYAVTLTASNGCFTETKTDTVNIGSVSIDNITTHEDIIKIANTGAHAVSIQVLNNQYTQLSIYNISGAKVKEYTHKNKVYINDLPYGVYVYKLSSRQEIVTGKFAIY